MEEKDFMELAFEKLINNLLSVKVWILLLNYGMATFLCWNDKITGTQWATAVATVTSTIIGMREIFKVAKVRSNDDTSNMQI